MTESDVTISPDGQWLIFTMLGHLFRLPVAGGTSEQLTFGPYYDSEPVVSPDNTRVAFVSDRDGSSGNIFVLDLASRRITGLTHESWTAGPVWSPDGRSIVYLRLADKDGTPDWTRWLTQVRRVTLDGQNSETVSARARMFRSVFYLADGHLAWAVTERDGERGVKTTIETVKLDGSTSTLRTLAGYVAAVVPDPTTGGLYARRARDPALLGPRLSQDDVIFIQLTEATERQIVSARGRRFVALAEMSRIAVAADGQSLYLEESGRLWRIALPSGGRELIPFSARVKLELGERIPVREARLPAVVASAFPRAILSPTLSPDGRTLVFAAAGFLWQQPASGGTAERLFKDAGFDNWPAFSPDGRRLAFVHSQDGQSEIKVFDVQSRETRTIVAGGAFWSPSWSPDAQGIAYVEREGFADRVMLVSVATGKSEKLVDASLWSPRPHFSATGDVLYFSARGTLYRLSLTDRLQPEPVTRLARHLSDGLVSRNGQWMAFRRNREIWVAPFGGEPVREERARRLATEGGDAFAFSPDGAEVIYSAGNRLWRVPLAGGTPKRIQVRLALQQPVAPPLLLRRVRVLDSDKGAFTSETSLFLEGGRIRWIGPEPRRKLPRDTTTLDARGRFAIPGLFDMHAHVPHLFNGNLEAFLAYGITSVRDPLASHIWMDTLADRLEAAGEPLPRYFGGDIFHGVLGHDLDTVIEAEADAESAVRRANGRRARFIKTYESLSWPQRQAVAQAARREGVAVAGHGFSVEQVVKGIHLGYASLEHGFDFHDDVIQLLAASGTWWVPTLSAAGGTNLTRRTEPQRFADPKFLAFVPTRCIGGGQGTASDTGLLLRVWADDLARLRLAYRRGAKLLAGTDYGCFYGPSLHWELEYFVQAGLTPLEVLTLATEQAAAAVGAQADLGTLEPGKLADIVLLDKSPLEDIRNTQAIWRVIKGGRVFDPESLRLRHESTKSAK